MRASKADQYRDAIARSGMSIYTPIDPDDPTYFIPNEDLEVLLNRGLVGLDLTGLSPRTRSKVIKEAACAALGYPAPKSFMKCQPRFTGQDFDISGQQSLNLQIWNEPLVATRRYALVRITPDHRVRTVLVVPGSVLIPFDTSGRLTTKYQAQVLQGPVGSILCTATDTEDLTPLLADHTSAAHPDFNLHRSPVDQPVAGELLPIQEIFRRLSPLVGHSFPDAGITQDRNRGAALHRLVCQRLGYQDYQDNGQFPDVRHQLLEVKLQTSPTIDLGLALPDSIGAIKGVHALAGGIPPRNCDTRYAIFCANIAFDQVQLHSLYLTTGEDFFNHFRQFQGKVQNSKIQIPLPRSLFGE